MAAVLLALFFWSMAIITVGLFVGKVWWLPELVSLHGASIDEQLILTLTVAGVTFLLSHILLGYFIWKYRARRGQRAKNWHDNPKLEATWTILTFILFVGLAVRGNALWADYILAEPDPNAIVVEVMGQQFAWNIRYPGKDGEFGRTDVKFMDDALANFIGLDDADPKGSDDIMTQNVMAIPVNRPVRIMLKTKDVIHSYFVPQLRVKQDAVPGLTIPVRFTATKTGEYEIACAELCGMQHYMMKGRLLVMEEADYEKWLEERAN